MNARTRVGVSATPLTLTINGGLSIPASNIFGYLWILVPTNSLSYLEEPKCLYEPSKNASRRPRFSSRIVSSSVQFAGQVLSTMACRHIPYPTRRRRKLTNKLGSGWRQSAVCRSRRTSSYTQRAWTRHPFNTFLTLLFNGIGPE